MKHFGVSSLNCGGPNGRRYWHNLALGPPPWEDAESPRSRPGTRLDSTHDESCRLKSLSLSDTVPPAAPARPSIPSPDEKPNGWIYHEGNAQRVAQLTNALTNSLTKTFHHVSPRFTTFHHFKRSLTIHSISSFQHCAHMPINMPSLSLHRTHENLKLSLDLDILVRFKLSRF